ncbi:MAG: hypothetical protein M3458_12520 [Acidobacteriota bacterium]|nr:hypothetical protein [Acidobacteriota bacterium]
MRLSETITIYLAVAAPIGVSQYLRDDAASSISRVRALALAAGAALVWPVTLWLMWLSHRRARAGVVLGERDAPSFDQRIDRAKRAVLAAIHQVEDIVLRSLDLSGEQSRYALFAAREAFERYVGLSVAASEVVTDRTPSARETELCRVAGRRGEDLLIAGLCTQRRGVARLLAHRDRARHDALHALAELHEMMSRNRVALHADAARQLAETMLQVYTRAIDLFSMLDDRRAATTTARLLDSQCARVRRYDSLNLTPAPEPAGEGVTCSTRLPSNSPVMHRPQSPTLARG